MMVTWLVVACLIVSVLSLAGILYLVLVLMPTSLRVQTILKESEKVGKYFE